MNREKTKISTIPIDVLFNKEINLIKATQISGITNSFVPIEFKIENEAFCVNDNYEVIYTTHINKVPIEAKYNVKKMRERNDNREF